MFLQLLTYFLLPADQYHCIVHDVTFQLQCRIFPHMHFMAFVQSTSTSGSFTKCIVTNHFTLLSIIFICPVCRIYIPFVFIANCVCVYNFWPVDPCIIQYAKSMAITSKTDVKLSCCPFKKSHTLRINLVVVT
jgi:hypothetical protein